MIDIEHRAVPIIADLIILIMDLEIEGSLEDAKRYATITTELSNVTALLIDQRKSTEGNK